jgi:hypothetical protein
MKLTLDARVWLSVAALLISRPLDAEGGTAGATPSDQTSSTLSSQEQSAIETEGVLGAVGAGIDTPANTVVAFQVGAFRVRARAERLIEEVGKDDFVGYLYTTKIKGADYWVVLVSSANNPFENRSDELSKAGFPSFPIRKGTLDAKLKLVPGQ